MQVPPSPQGSVVRTHCDGGKCRDQGPKMRDGDQYVQPACSHVSYIALPLVSVRYCMSIGLWLDRGRHLQ